MADRGSPFDLAGRKALVTGAGRGIGAGCATALAQAGADVTVVSRTAEELERVVSRITEAGGLGRALVCDVTDPAAVTREIAPVADVDILVNSAGTNIPEAFLDLATEDFETVMRVNVTGTFLVTQAVARAMVARGAGGSIISVSSQMGHVGGPRRAAYCASKHAVEGFTKAVALELAGHGVRVNTVAPTYIETEMTKPYLEKDDEFRRDVLRRIPMARIGSVDDVVGAVIYLASPAAALVTGTSLMVDGGYTAQ